MWGVPPAMLCRKHLLGEHVELHMFVGTINKGISVQGYIDKGLLNTRIIQSRHEELVQEMSRRGYNHRTPLKFHDPLGRGSLDIPGNLLDLSERCKECAELQKRYVIDGGLIPIRR